MSPFVRKLANAAAAGCYLVLATECTLAAMRPAPIKITPFTDAERAEAVLAAAAWANDQVRNLDQAAGATHDYVGNDPVQCSLCLMPAAHPIHTWPSEIVDSDGI